MKSLLALAIMLSSLAAFGVATSSPAEAHFKKRHHHAKYYKAKKCQKWRHVSFRKYRKCRKHW